MIGEFSWDRWRSDGPTGCILSEPEPSFEKPEKDTQLIVAYESHVAPRQMGFEKGMQQGSSSLEFHNKREWASKAGWTQGHTLHRLPNKVMKHKWFSEKQEVRNANPWITKAWENKMNVYHRAFCHHYWDADYCHVFCRRNIIFVYLKLKLNLNPTSCLTILFQYIQF